MSYDDNDKTTNPRGSETDAEEASSLREGAECGEVQSLLGSQEADVAAPEKGEGKDMTTVKDSWVGRCGHICSE